MKKTSGDEPRIRSSQDFAAMLSKLTYEEWIQLFEALKEDFRKQAKKRQGDQQKQLANMIQSVAYNLGQLKKRLKQMETIRGYKGKPSVLRGYHGTTLFAAKRVLAENAKHNPAPFQESRNEWDWLGSGVYFWLEAPHRAAERSIWWYRILRLQRPWLPDLENLSLYPPPQGYRSHFAVIEARIRLFPQTTLNLLDTSWVEELKHFRDKFTARVEKKLEPEKTLAKSNYDVVLEPWSKQTNEGILLGNVKHAKKNLEGLMRTRDCQLFNEFLKEFGHIQCVVAAFREGYQIIPDVNIWDKDHVQINVVDQSAINRGSIKVHDAAKLLDVM